MNMLPSGADEATSQDASKDEDVPSKNVRVPHETRLPDKINLPHKMRKPYNTRQPQCGYLKRCLTK
jgi:hypothetical protein